MTLDSMTPPTIEDFPFRATEKLRFGDMDRQGHVNNVAYMSFFETGRVVMSGPAATIREDEGIRRAYLGF